MQMTEDMIRSVVQQVLNQMGTGAAPSNGNGKASGGDYGVFPTVEGAVAAADSAFQKYRDSSLADRRKAVSCIRDILGVRCPAPRNAAATRSQALATWPKGRPECDVA